MCFVYFFIIIKLTKNITPYYNGDIYRALQFKTGNVILKTINFHRRILAMSEKLIGACIFGQSGGPTAVINASAYGVISAALESGEITKVYGASHGINDINNGTEFVHYLFFRFLMILISRLRV